MKLTVRMILKQFKNTHLLSVNSYGAGHEDELFVESCAFLTGDQISWESDILYFGTGQQVNDWAEEAEKCAFFITGDCSAEVDRKNCVIRVSDSKTILPMFNHVIQVIYEYSQMELNLSALVSRNRTLQEMVDLVTPYFNNEILIMNSNFRIVAQSFKENQLLRLSGLPQTSSDGLIPMEVANYFRNDQIYKKVEKISEPFYYNESIFNHRVLCMNIFVQKEYVSRIVLCEIDHAIEKSDEYLLSFFASYVQIVYSKQGLNTVNLYPSGILSVIWKLLYESPVHTEDCEKALLRHQWQMQDEYLCFCILPQGNSPRDIFLPYYCDQINSRFDNVFAVEFNNEIAGIVNLKSYHHEGSGFAWQFAEFQRDANFRIGYSEKFRMFSELKAAFLQAEIALRQGLAVRPEKWSFWFSDYYYYFVHSVLTEKLPENQLLPECLLKLKYYDSENGTEYERTLRIYMKNNMNAVRTAAELFIHRATMVYRLKRISEIASLSFDDNDMLLRIRLSFRLFE